MADFGNTTVFSQTDANNNSGTVPTWAEGMAPSQVNDSARALQGAAFREWNWRNPTVTSAGTANAQTLTYSVAPAAYYNGQAFAFIAGFAPTSTMTLNVNGIGATAVKKDVGGTFTALAGYEFVAGNIVTVVYNSAGTCFVITGISQAASDRIVSTDPGAAEGPTRYLDRNSASPAANDVLGAWGFLGRSSTAVERAYARIRALIKTATNASEDGLLALRTMLAGTEADRFIVGGGLYSANATGGDKGEDSINSSEYYDDGVKIGPWRHVATLSPSAVASIDQTGLSAYAAIRICFLNIKPGTDGVRLIVRVSSDNGSTFETTNYSVTLLGIGGSSAAADTTNGFSLEEVASPGSDIGNAAADGGLAGEFTLLNFNVAQKTVVQGMYTFGDTGAARNSVIIQGWHSAQTAMNALRFVLSSGNFSAGSTIVIEGLPG